MARDKAVRFALHLCITSMQIKTHQIRVSMCHRVTRVHLASLSH